MGLVPPRRAQARHRADEALSPTRRAAREQTLRVPRVAALRVPWFAAAAVRRREPALVDQALVLGAPHQGAWRVLALSAEAAAAGVRVGMPLAQAEGRCATLVRRPFDPAHLARETERLLAALEAHVALEATGLGEALFPPPRDRIADGTGTAAAPGADERRPLARLVDALAAATGYLPAVGVADGRGPAAIAARQAAAGVVQWVPPGGVAAYLTPLPAARLPVSPAMQQRLALLGLNTIGTLAALPLGAVQAQFGPEGHLAWQIAHGRDTRPLAPRTPPVLPSAEVTLEAPCVDRARLLAVGAHLLAVAWREVPPGLAVGGLRLSVALESHATWEQARVLHTPTAEPGPLRFALEGLLRDATLPAPAVGARLELYALGPLVPRQPTLFGEPNARGLPLAAIRKLRAQFGTNPLQRILALDPAHRLPERRYALTSAEC